MTEELPGPFFRFPDEDTGMVALYNAGLLDSYTSEVITASHTHALDVIGEIPETTGWHVNYVGEVPEGWEQYAVSPEQPVRVWAS
jgi:hypothetical protein